MNRLTGTWPLVRLALRRDRVLLPVWIVIFWLVTASTASATMALYPDPASRLMAASAVNDVPVALALYGRIWDPTSIGALSLLKLGAFGSSMLAILAIMLMVRHSRAEEEKGRTELIGATVVGGWAWLAAAFVVTGGTMLAVGLGSAAGLVAVGLPVTGSLAFGLSWAMTGIAFAAIAALCAQLASTARGANGLAMIVLATAFLLRAIGDVGGDETEPALWSWLSPTGWGQQVRPYAGDRLWVLLIPLAFSAIALWCAAALQSHRDLDAGLLPDRPGHARASRWLASPMALAWRLQRGLLIGWLVAYVIMSAIVGSMINDLGSMMDTPQAQQMVAALGGSDVLLQAFITMEFSIIAFATASYGIAVVRKLATEEADGHAEVVLATAVSRSRLLASHLTVAVVGATILTLAQGLAFGLANAAATGTGELIWPTVGAAVVFLPPVWLMIGIAIALFGFVPRLTSLAWAVVVAFLLVSEVGALLEWPQWVMDTSPFAQMPRLPGASMQWTPVIIVTLIAAALVAIGALRWRQRDLATP